MGAFPPWPVGMPLTVVQGARVVAPDRLFAHADAPGWRAELNWTTVARTAFCALIQRGGGGVASLRIAFYDGTDGVGATGSAVRREAEEDWGR